MKRPWIEILVPALLLLLFLGLRIHAPTADLPADISFSGSVYTDEGNQCHNSRSKVLFGEWYPDDWRITHYNPVVPYLKYGIFKIFGVGLVQVRSVSFLFAFLSLLFFYLTLRSYRGIGFAAVGTSLLGINFLFLMFNKIGTFETPMIFWMILALFFIERFRRSERPVFLLFAGASAYMAFVFKNTAAHFLPVPLLACLLVALFPGTRIKSPSPGWLKRCGFVLAGLGAALVLWLVLFYMPNREWIWSAPGQYIGKQMFPGSFSAAVGNFLAFNWQDQFFKIPIVWLLSLLYLPFYYRRLFKRSSDITETGFFLYFLSHTLFFMIISNRPTRYLVPVIPAMTFFATLFLSRLVQSRRTNSSRFSWRQKLGLIPLDTLWLALISYFCLIPLYSRYVQTVRTPPLSIHYLWGGLIVLTFLYGMKWMADRWLMNHPLGIVRAETVFKTAAVVILLVASVVNIGQYIRWGRQKTRYVETISRELGAKIENAYIAGLTAPVAVLENRHRSLFLFPRFVNWTPDTFERYPLTHSLLASFNHEISLHFDAWPRRMERAVLLRAYNVKDQFLHLYSFKQPYIEDVSHGGEGRIRVRVFNPSPVPVQRRMGMVAFSRVLDGGDADGVSFSILPQGDRTWKPGENTIQLAQPDTAHLPGSPLALLFFLGNPEWGQTHRYEGEKFPRRVGVDMAVPGVSGGIARVFRRGKDRPGYLTFGPFIPHAPGFLLINFRIRFDKIRPGIRPLCGLDVFSYREKISLARGDLKPRDVQSDIWDNHRIWVAFSDTKTLEYRLYAEGWSDIMLDYVEVTYLQGKMLWYGDEDRMLLQGSGNAVERRKGR